MFYSLTLFAPNRGDVPTTGPRLVGYSGPVTDEELREAEKDHNLPPYLAALKIAGDAPFADRYDSMTPAQRKAEMPRVVAIAGYGPGPGTMADMISCMPDEHFARIDAGSVAKAESFGWITPELAHAAYVRLAQAHLDGLADGPVPTKVQAVMGALLP